MTGMFECHRVYGAEKMRAELNAVVEKAKAQAAKEKAEKELLLRHHKEQSDNEMLAMYQAGLGVEQIAGIKGKPIEYVRNLVSKKE